MRKTALLSAVCSVAITATALSGCDQPGAGSIVAPLQASANLLANCSAATPAGCLTKSAPEQVQPGYTYVDTAIDQTAGLPNKGYLIDPLGNLVHTWDVGFGSKVLPDGHVLGGLPFPGAGTFTINLDCLFELDWDSNVVWPPNGATVIGANGGRFCDPNGQVIGLNTDSHGRAVTWQHHDIQRPGNPVGYYAPSQTPEIGGGTTLILAAEFPPLAETSQISNFPLYSEKIDEVDVDSNGTNVLWEWHSYDHFGASGGDLGYGFDPVATEAIKTIRVNIGNPNQGNTTDWLHINGASYVGKNRWCPNPDRSTCDRRFLPDNIIFSSRQANFLAIIARHDDPQGAWRSGDIIWRVGPNFDYGPGKVDQLIGLHHAHIIPFPLPGAGNMMVMDNGGTAGYGADANGNPTYPNKSRRYSRVIEFDPISLDVVFMYERPDPNTVPAGENFAPFRSDLAGSAQRLVNGDTLITEALSGRIFEITSAGELVWEWVSPFGPLPPYGNPALGTARPGDLVYRAYRIPEQWVSNHIHGNSSSGD